jgi:hypothetical protein
MTDSEDTAIYPNEVLVGQVEPGWKRAANELKLQKGSLETLRSLVQGGRSQIRWIKRVIGLVFSTDLLDQASARADQAEQAISLGDISGAGRLLHEGRELYRRYYEAVCKTLIIKAGVDWLLMETAEHESLQLQVVFVDGQKRYPHYRDIAQRLTHAIRTAMQAATEE